MSRRTQQELTRADRVRMRKTTQGSTRAKQTRQRVHRYAAEVTPVTVRGGLGTPVIQRTRTKTRRKFSIPLDQRGTEMQLPALPIVHPGWRILSAFLVVVFSLLIYWAYDAPALRVTAPEINGLKHIPAGDILRSLDLVDRPIFTIDPQQITEELAKDFPDLVDTSVEVQLPATVIITTSETEPVIIWQLEYRSLWSDETGKIIPQRGEPGDILTVEVEGDLPIKKTEVKAEENVEKEDNNQTKTASNEPQYVDLMLLKAALTLGESAPDGAILTYNTRDGLGLYDTNGWKVNFGTEMNNLDQKLVVYQEITAQLEKEGFQPGMISVEHVHAPFYRMEH